MSDVIQHDTHKFSDAGLQLRTPVDMVPPNQYSLLTNALPIIEGRLEARAGLSFITNMPNTSSPGSGLHSLTRLNQEAISAVGDRIAGVDTTVRTLALPSGNSPTTRDTNRTGDPLSLPNFHFQFDTAAWQIVADRGGMRKYRGGTGSGYYVNLGILPPSRSLASNGIIGAAATATANGSGVLVGGPTAGNVIVRPTTLLNGWGANGHVGAYELGVDQGFGFGLNGPASPYSNPGNAFDGDENTAASVVCLHSHTYFGCVWSFSFAGTVTTGIQLNILSEVPSPGPFGISPSGWLRSAGIWYSLDGGTTWTQVYNQNTRSKQWDAIPLASTQNLNNVQVMAFTDAHDNMAHNVFEINIAPSSAPGPGYDWVYTYVNTVTQSESMLSITNWGTSFEQIQPATVTTPDPSFGGSAASASTTTSATLNAGSAAETRQSVLFSNFPASTTQYQALYFEIQMTAAVTFGTTGGCVYWAVYFSLDSGTTWDLAIDGNNSVDYGATDLLPAFLLFLNQGQDLTKLQVRACAFGVGNTTVPQNVTARRIRDLGGNLNVSSLLTGGGGNATVTLTITNLKTTGIFLNATPNTLSLASQQALVTVVNPFDPQVNAIRLYRRGGTVTASWAFVGQFAVTAHDGSTQQISDNVADVNLGQFVSLSNDAPVVSVYASNRFLPSIWGPAFDPALMFGCGDPDRPSAVYFSNPGNADNWANGQWIDVSSPSDPMQTGTVFNTRNFAFSHERMFEITQTLAGGTSLIPYETPCRRGLISPWGLVTTARAVYFVAKDGIYATTGGQEQSLVENNIKPLFPTLDGPGRTVETYPAVDMERIEDIRLRHHNDELYFIYRGLNGTITSLVYDQNKDRWRAASYPVNVATFYSEEGGQSSLLVGDSSGSMYSTARGNGDVLQASNPAITVTLRTGAFDQGIPLNQKEYGNVLFDIDPGGATIANPVTITPLLNGETITGSALTITGSGRQQVPLSLSDVFGFNLEFAISFIASSTINPILYQFDILWRPEPVQVVHWEAREDSYGMPGWGHVRDAYIAIRSNATVTLTATFDGVVQTYSIPSTSNARRKVYLPFAANKWKLARFSFDSSAQFRIYEQDCELRVKPWLTSLGYRTVKAWGAESQLVAPAYESTLLGGS